MFSLRSHPDDVVLLIESHNHETRILTFTAKPMDGFAGHDGEPAGGERYAAHPLHAGRYPPPDDDELFLRGMKMSRHLATGRRLQNEGRRAGGGVAGCEGAVV